MGRLANANASSRLVCAAALISMLAAVRVEAAGLGEIQTSSALGQPFEARIDLSGSEDELESAQAVIAPESAYDQAGLPRATVLDKLQVEVVHGGSGAPYLRIRSRQFVGEPMLQLMVDLRAGGRTVRREYTVLLDPPTDLASTVAAPRSREARVPPAVSATPATSPGPSASEPTAPPVSASATTLIPPAKVGRRRAAAGAAPVSAAASAGSAGHYGPVVAGETLGSIAERLRERLGGSFQSRVDAIRRANPGAFEAGRPSWIRLGAMLVVPGLNESASAVAEPGVAAIPGAPPLAAVPGATSHFRLAERLAEVPTSPPVTTTAVLPAAPAPAPAPTAVAPAKAPVAAPPAFPAAVPAAATASRTDAKSDHWWTDLRLWILLLVGGLLFAGWQRRRQWHDVDPLDEEPLHDAALSASSPVAVSSPRPVMAKAVAPEAPPKPATEPESRPEPFVEAVSSNAQQTPAPIAELQKPEPIAAEPVIETDAATPAEENIHGFYGEVAQLLLTALTREPGRRDLRMKLLEVYYESREVELFHKHARLYLQSLEGRDDEHWPRIQAMGREMLPAASLFTAQSRTALALAARPLRFYEHDMADTLEPALQALASDYRALHVDAEFRDELLLMLAVIRPPGLPLAPLQELTEEKLAQVWCKWEQVDPVGDAAHVNAYSQAFMASRLHRDTLITATRSGRHGIAVASAAAELGLSCNIHMHESDYEQHPDSTKQMRSLGARVIVHPDGVFPGDARTAALREWLHDAQRTLYISSLAAGPHPFPAIVRDFQALLGAETKAQVIERFQRRPLAVVVSRDDGPAAISILQAFLDDRETALYCIDSERPSPNPAYRREHSWLQHTGRVQYLPGRDAEAEDLRIQLALDDAGLPAIGSARAASFARRIADQSLTPGEVVVLMRREAENAKAPELDLDLESLLAQPAPASAPLELPELSLDEPFDKPPEPSSGELDDRSEKEPQLKPTIGLVRSRR